MSEEILARLEMIEKRLMDIEKKEKEREKNKQEKVPFGKRYAKNGAMGVSPTEEKQQQKKKNIEEREKQKEQNKEIKLQLAYQRYVKAYLKKQEKERWEGGDIDIQCNDYGGGSERMSFDKWVARNNQRRSKKSVISNDPPSQSDSDSDSDSQSESFY